MAPLSSVVQNLRYKSILVTGCTGFLAKIFVEKILRVQPEVKRLYLLIRASDAKSAKQRVDGQVMNKEVFRVLRSKHGDEFEAFVSQKICAVAGDVTEESLGITEIILREEILKEVDIIVHVAATTSFYERYDIALNVNALGARGVLDFAHKCEKLEMFLHVSTAFVWGSRSGVILEKPLQMGETPYGNHKVDIEEELRLAEEELQRLQNKCVGDKAETAAMKEFGLKRARLLGWPNAYSFTKAMGEMLIGESRKQLPVVIIRPTIIEATLADPFPGWVEGFRTTGSVILSYGKGRLKCFPAKPHLPIDVIPADMVVNAMVVSMAVHSRQSGEFIYHVGSSCQNPLTTSILADCAFRYFSSKPLKGKDGNVIRVPKLFLYSSMASFRNYMNLHYNFPLKGLKLANLALFNMCGQLCDDLTRKYKFIMYLAGLYEPYVFFDGSFDDKNSDKLRMAIKSISVAEEAMFNFDPKCVKWEEYCMSIFYPGLVRYSLK